MRIVFWQNMLAIHQSAHIRALAANGDNEVTLVVQEPLDPERRRLGWSIPDFGRTTVVIDPINAVIEALIHERPDESVHVFSAIHAFPLVEKAFFRCLPTAARIGLLVESQDFRGWLGILRLMRARADALRYAKRISFILAMGTMGVDWFSRCGFSRTQIFPYGYFVEIPMVHALPRDTSKTVQIIYLGQLVPRKGVDVLLNALGGLSEQNWALTIMGSGSSKPHLEHLIKRLEINDRVKFLPVQSNAEAVSQIARHDLFVLPSHFDGWGAVVNEALMCGVPVICSDRCGAAELLNEPWLGEAFTAGSVKSLEAILRSWITYGKRTIEETERIRAWSRCIEGDVAADYLLKCVRAGQLQEPRPAPPWNKKFSEGN